MITLKDIKLAVNSKLKSAFGYEINSNDVKEGFKRPSFFVSFDNVKRSSTETQINRTLTIRIYFFPSDRHNYSLEILEVTEKLEDEFDLKLPVLERLFHITEVESEVSDGVLNFSFDIDYHEGKEYEDYTDDEIMQELNIERVRD